MIANKTKKTLLKYFSKDNLLLAWHRYIRSTGKDSKDYFGIKLYSANLDKNLGRLSNSLISGKYKPQRPFKYYEPKASKTQRTKSVLLIEDALFYQSIANEVASKNYKKLSENYDFVFGSVLNEEVKIGTKILKNKEAEYFFFQYYLPLYNKFANSVNKQIENSDIKFKLETDITGFFDSIPHSKLFITLNKFGVEPVILDLLNDSLNIFSGTKESVTPGVGIPQGPAASFFFANLLLNDLDHLLIKDGYCYYRYMDDIRIYEESEEKLTDAIILIDKYLKGKALSLNTKKTSIQEIKNRDTEKIDPIFDYDLHEDYEEQFQEERFLLDQNSNIDQDELFIIKNISGSDLIQFCKNEIKEVEDLLFEKFEARKLPAFNPFEFISDDFFNREIINLAYRWRNSNSILKKEHKPILNKKLIGIWLFCLEHLFWKANHFCWNLNLYGPNIKISKELKRLNKKFGKLEWVSYQILSNMAFVQKFSLYELKTMFRNITNEQSSLVRLGYYMILLKNVSKKNQLYSSILKSIRDDGDKYIKRYLAGKFFSQIKKDDFSEIKFWFGL